MPDMKQWNAKIINGDRVAQCNECRFFDPSGYEADGKADDEGYCKRCAPSVGDGGRAQFPLICEFDWCGQYEPTWKEIETWERIYREEDEKDQGNCGTDLVAMGI